MDRRQEHLDLATSSPESSAEPRPSWAVWLVVVLGIGMFLTLYRVFGDLADGHDSPILERLIQEMTAAFGGGLLFWPLRALVRYRPLDVARPLAGHLASIGLYAGALAVFSIANTSWNWFSRAAAYRVLGLGHYDYGEMPLRYTMEFGIHAIAFPLLTVGLHMARRLHQAREREIRAARLESALARAQVHNLRLQLQPHFLFNALNTISATLHRDPDTADEMIDRLAGLLRASLGEGRDDEVSLATELELLDAYLGIQRARFADRLDVGITVDPELDTHTLAVPPLLLQPLVENAVRHGGAERDGRGRIEVTIGRDADTLTLDVHDDGPGAPTTVDPLHSGTGLAATAGRLRLLYGDAHRFEAANAETGAGFHVRIRLPYRPLGSPRPESAR